jgi:hypothetical protein
VCAVAVPENTTELTFVLGMFVRLPVMAPAGENVKATSPNALLCPEYEIPVPV